MHTRNSIFEFRLDLLSIDLPSVVPWLPQESVLLFKDVYAVLMKMLINMEDSPGDREASEDGEVEHNLGVVDEERERGLEV